jgi:hypothetical protein
MRWWFAACGLVLPIGCGHRAPPPEDPDPDLSGDTTVECYAGIAHISPYYHGEPSDPAAHLRVTFSPSFSSITEEWRFDEEEPVVYDVSIDGTSLTAHRRGDDDHDDDATSVGSLEGAPGHPDTWNWTITRRGQYHEGFYYERTAAGLKVSGGSWTFEPDVDVTAELAPADCSADW